MRLAPLALLPLIVLAACASPRDSCINDATRDLRRVNAFITEAQENIARGYAFETRQEVRVRPDICEGVTEDGVTFTYECERTAVVDVPFAVPIDIAAERAKLESLLEQQALLERQAEARIEACIAAYPEE